MKINKIEINNLLSIRNEVIEINNSTLESIENKNVLLDLIKFVFNKTPKFDYFCFQKNEIINVKFFVSDFLTKHELKSFFENLIVHFISFGLDYDTKQYDENSIEVTFCPNVIDDFFENFCQKMFIQYLLDKNVDKNDMFDINISSISKFKNKNFKIASLSFNANKNANENYKKIQKNILIEDIEPSFEMHLKRKIIEFLKKELEKFKGTLKK